MSIEDTIRRIVREEIERALGIQGSSPSQTAPVASPADGKFYYIGEVAEALRRSDASTRWLIQTGALKSTKIGGRRVVTQAQLDEFFAPAAGEGN